jgi:hypothetical protein
MTELEKGRSFSGLLPERYYNTKLDFVKGKALAGLRVGNGEKKGFSAGWVGSGVRGKRREIPHCAGRPLRRSEAGRKSVGLLRSE